MDNIYEKNEVIQFNEKHKWCGCFGFIDEVKQCGNDIKYLIGVPCPESGIAYIFSMQSKNEFEYIGRAKLIISNGEEV